MVNEILSKIDNKLRVTSERIKDTMPYTTKPNGEYDDKFHGILHGWTNGFYPGLLWLMYEETGYEPYRKYAVQIDRKLAKALNKPSVLHHDMGFMYMLSSVKEYELTNNEEALEEGLLAAIVLASRYNIKSKYIRAWQGTEEMGTFGIIDCMMNLPILYWASEIENDNRYKKYCRQLCSYCYEKPYKRGWLCKSYSFF